MHDDLTPATRAALAAAWQEVDEAQTLREAADEKRNAALQRVQDTLVTLALQLGDNVEQRDKVIQHLYWREPDIKSTWLAEAFSLKVHQIVEVAGKASLALTCGQCGVKYHVIVTSRTNMRERKQSHRSGNSVLVMCDGCRDAIFRERSARAASERAAQEERLWELRTMPYREYLLTPEWQARRLQQFKRAGYRCQVCNTNRAQLNVHHRTYERRGDESFKDLVVLCADCHTIFHQQGKLARD